MHILIDTNEKPLKSNDFFFYTHGMDKRNRDTLMMETLDWLFTVTQKSYLFDGTPQIG